MHILKNFASFQELNEYKMTSDDKFEWISQKMGEWIFNEYMTKKSDPLIRSLDLYLPFINWMKNNYAKENIDQTYNVVDSMINHMEDFLNSLDKKESQDLINDARDKIEGIKRAMLRYGKPENPWGELGKRGRKPGSKNKPKPEILIQGPAPVRQSMYEPEPEIVKEPIGQSNQEIMDEIQKMEQEADYLDKHIDYLTNKVKNLVQEIDRRKQSLM